MATITDGKGTIALAAFDKGAILKKHEFGRPAPGPNDIAVEIKYCGMCHSDLHNCNDEWGFNFFPIAPGHEIGGIVKEVGSDVTKFKKGDRVGVGCFVESCFECEQCGEESQQYCSKMAMTYGSEYPKGKGHDECAGTHTNGGYSDKIVVRQEFVYAVPDGLELEYVGPLLCAGITMFSPLNRHVLKKGGKKKVGIVGFGGLGHMGAKIAKAMDSEVTFLSRNLKKKDEADALGAGIIAHSDEEAIKGASKTFDVILDTVSAPHEIEPILSTLKVGGSYVCIGAVVQQFKLSPMSIIFTNYKIEGSMVGGIAETQEMLDFCTKHDIKPEIKIIHAKDANAQFKAFAEGDADPVRAVIDISTLSEV